MTNIIIVAIGILWKSKLEDIKYIRDQDKANTELMMSITNTMDDLAKTSDSSGIKLDDLKDKVNNILNLITERLK